MRYIIAALLIAGAAGCGTKHIDNYYVESETAEQYQWADAPPFGQNVDSLTDIRPTPAEMESEGK